MKSNKLYFFIFIFLLIIVGYLFYNNKSGTFKKELNNFAVKDTGNITMIFLADKQGAKVKLEKQDNGRWRVNKNYFARPEAINTLLKTFVLLDVKAPVPKPSMNTIIRNLSAVSTKVEIYVKDKLEKVYYVGGSTMDKHGTYMLLENSSSPFIMHIPGFFGYLSTRYFTDEHKWRDPEIFNFEPGEISSVQVHNIIKPQETFKIAIENNKPILTIGGKTQENPEVEKLAQYIGLYRKIAFEYVDNFSSPVEKDSIFKSPPIFEIQLVPNSAESVRVVLYKKHLKEPLENERGEKIFSDPDRMYANYNGELVVVQYFVFDALTVSPQLFFNSANVKN